MVYGIATYVSPPNVNVGHVNGHLHMQCNRISTHVDVLRGDDATPDSEEGEGSIGGEIGRS